MSTTKAGRGTWQAELSLEPRSLSPKGVQVYLICGIHTVESFLYTSNCAKYPMGIFHFIFTTSPERRYYYYSRFIDCTHSHREDCKLGI